jgi:hypothetical protein
VRVCVYNYVLVRRNGERQKEGEGLALWV